MKANVSDLSHTTANSLSYDTIPRSSTFSTLIKDGLQYAIAASIFILYGIQVCPFLDSLELPFFTIVVSALFTGMFLLRTLLSRYINTVATHNILKKQLLLDIAIFLFGGISLAIGNQLVYGFPIDSSIRVILGILLLGFLISLQLVLQKEHQLIQQLQQHNSSSYLPITLKIQFFTFALLISAILILLLLIYKDFEWLQQINQEISLEQASLWILYEFLFVSAVFIGYGLLIIKSFSKNVQAYFHHQNTTLAAVEKGQRKITVPIISNDEFSTMAEHTNHMINSLALTEKSLKQTRDAAILAISSLAETRDNETGAHILRTQEYVKVLGCYLQNKDEYKAVLSDETLDLIYKSAPLHDIGKVGIPDAILLKPGKLTDKEFDVMKSHPIIGKQAIEKAEQQTGPLPFLHYAKEISESHHEKWDGSGYPYGLKGDEIPLSGRLMALADVYDALISQRVYKPAFSHNKSKEIILAGKGKHFDPAIVEAFEAVEKQFIVIAEKYKG